MVRIQINHFDIQSEEWTGIIIKIIDEEGAVITTYRNFNPDDIRYKEQNPLIAHKNHIEEFEVSTVELAKKIIESNASYVDVKEVV